VEPPGAALLIAPAGVLERPPADVDGAGPATVPLPAVAPAAQEEQLLAAPPGADDQPQRIHALPRSGRGGWTSTERCAKKGAAWYALPRVISPEGPGCPDSGPHPSAPSAGPIYLISPGGRNRLHRQPVPNSALSDDRQHRGAALCRRSYAPGTARCGRRCSSCTPRDPTPCCPSRP
jgi:hypothetical protein